MTTEMNITELHRPSYKRLINAFLCTSRSISNHLLHPHQLLNLLLTGPSRSFPIAKSHERRFIAAAEANLDNFALLECERGSDGRVIDLRYLYINQRGAQYMLLLPEQIIGKRITEVCPLIHSHSIL